MSRHTFFPRNTMAALKAIREQVAALAPAEFFDFSFIYADADLHPEVEPKFRSMRNMRWVESTVVDMMSLNENRYNVFITPIHSKFFFIVVDDIRDYETFLSWNPVLAQQTSEKSRQGILLLPSSTTEKGSREWGAARELVKELNGLIGDPGVSSPRQAFRLAGFRNKKRTRNNEVVRILHNSPGAVPGKFVLDRFHALLASASSVSETGGRAQSSPSIVPGRAYDVSSPSSPLPDGNCLEDLIAAQRKHFSGDRSQADYMAVCDLARAGYSEDEIITALESTAARKSKPRYYATLTVQKVFSRRRSHVR